MLLLLGVGVLITWKLCQLLNLVTRTEFREDTQNKDFLGFSMCIPDKFEKTARK